AATRVLSKYEAEERDTAWDRTARTAVSERTRALRLDHSQAPLVDGIQAYREADMVPFSTPGHKRGSGISPEAIRALGIESFLNDIPLGGGIDDSHLTLDVLGKAERLAADAFSADRTFFLLNGSSIGNQVGILALVKPGDEIVLARNVHKSILTALILSGARPIYVKPRYDPEFEVAHGLVAEDLAETLDAHPNAKAVVVVSPTYFGVASDLPRLAEICHERGLPLHVDEAWAPHFPFHPDLPPSAMQAGADSAVTSIHKLLTGFTQSAILNIQGDRVDPSEVARWLSLIQTTSPSGLIHASIDACRRQMVLEGKALLDRTIALGNMGRERIKSMPGIKAMGLEVLERPGVTGFDLTKLVVDVSDTGLTGYEVEAWLRAKRRITLEMSDHRRIVALLSIADTEASVGHLLDSLSVVACELQPSQTKHYEAPHDITGLETESVITPAEAFRAPVRLVSLAESAGKISSDVITPYPPGIPILAPGERITRPIVEYLQAGLKAGMHVAGPSDPTLATMRVVR
ncbi:MAG: cad, partial [Chloroflexi bacterium]|nr:cad [Chloroflexota bacterium]